jgi:outer membrane protein assembly factor BamB
MGTELLYIGSNGHVAAIDPATGRQVWRTQLGGGGLFSSTRAQDVTVLQHEAYVFAGCAGHLFCLDARTGTERWNNGLEGMGHNDVTLAIAGKSIQYVATHTHTHG